MSARVGGGILGPLGEYQLVLREHLDAYGRAIALGRAVVWATRGLCVGLAVDAVVLLLQWVRLMAPPTPSVLLMALPLGLAVGAGTIVAARPRTREWVARRVDARLGLAERSLTAIGAPRDQGQAGSLHLWQIRDAVQHLEKREPLRSFPVPVPQPESLLALGLAALVALLVAVPSPFPQRGGILDARGQLVRDEAERLTRIAQSLAEDPALQNRDLEKVREMLRQAARGLEQNVNNPERAAASVEDIERELQAMAQADEELALALATVASALASTGETRDLASAFQSGDLREVSRAARDLARQAEGMSANARARAGRALRSASERAGDASGVQRQLAQAANALDPEGAGMEGLSDREALAQAQGALRELAESSASAAARQRAQSALQGARNALNRGQSGTRPPSSGSFGRESARDGARGERGNGAGQAEGEGENGEGEGEAGSSYGTGTLNRQGDPSRLDAMTRPEQLRSGGGVLPDEIADAPMLQAAGENPSRLGDESVQAQFARQPATDPSVDASIPLGLRELVKEYFSSEAGR